MQINFERLKPHHSKQYREIRLESLKNSPENFGSTYEEQKALTRLAFENYIEDQHPGNFIIGAFDGEELIGICGFAQSPKTKCQHIGTIVQMYVKQAYQGKGLGKQLMQKTIEEAFDIPEIEQVTLGVITTNTQAFQLYEKLGFQGYSIHRNFLKMGDKYYDQKFMVLYRNDHNTQTTL